jgi:predicted nuclease with TOPRIM domain
MQQSENNAKKPTSTLQPTDNIQVARLRDQNLTLARKYEQAQEEVERCHD